MPEGNVEQLLENLEGHIKRVGDEVKSTAETALKQSKEAGDVSAEVKAQADKLLATQNELNARLGECEQRLVSRPGNGDDVARAQSMGAQVANHDKLKQFVSAGKSGSVTIPVKMAITSDSGSPGSAGDLIWSDRDRQIVRLPRRTLTIRDLLMPGQTSSNLVEYAKQTLRDNQAAPVAEEGTKPESDYKWERADAPVRTIAHIVHVSRQAFDDAPQLQSEIDGELRYGLELVEETQLLKGSGAGQNLSGLVTEATAFSAEFTPASQTMIDTLRLAALQASLNEFPATGIVLHPTDWTRIELTKDGENRYLWSNPRGMAAPGMWGLPIVETQSMDEDEFLVGAFMTAATIYDRMDAEVLISSEHSDNFIKNMLTVRAEKRLALAVKRPTALVTGDFGNITG